MDGFERLQAVVDELLVTRDGLILEMAAAFMRKTQIPADRVMLMIASDDSGMRFWFEDREKVGTKH